ncbi:hypothetical protein SUGI_0231750 [Cryptomeria japonica]|nr:hypothetical protein SUGI_0231750 [Cryptomeria japonica]
MHACSFQLLNGLGVGLGSSQLILYTIYNGSMQLGDNDQKVAVEKDEKSGKFRSKGNFLNSVNILNKGCVAARVPAICKEMEIYEKGKGSDFVQKFGV